MSRCLVLIDIQNDYFSGGRMELVGMAEAAASVLARFRKEGETVVHFQHRSVRPGAGFFVPGTVGVEIDEAVVGAAELLAGDD